MNAMPPGSEPVPDNERQVQKTDAGVSTYVEILEAM